MADSNSLRSRRYRLHRAGNHSLCKHDAEPGGPRLRLAGPPAEVDARAELAALAARLVTAHEDDPGNPMLAREVRMTLQALLPGGPEPGGDSELGDLFAALQS